MNGHCIEKFQVQGIITASEGNEWLSAAISGERILCDNQWGFYPGTKHTGVSGHAGRGSVVVERNPMNQKISKELCKAMKNELLNQYRGNCSRSKMRLLKFRY